MSTVYKRILLKVSGEVLAGEKGVGIDFDKVLEIDPDNTMARFNRGLLRVNVGDYSGAVGDYSKVIEDYPNFEYAYQCRADAYRNLGERKKAEAEREKEKKSTFPISCMPNTVKFSAIHPQRS